jgi:hypothetical protein
MPAGFFMHFQRKIQFGHAWFTATQKRARRPLLLCRFYCIAFAVLLLQFCFCSFAFAVLLLQFCFCSFAFAVLLLQFCFYSFSIVALV